jgi:hypothetical protein
MRSKVIVIEITCNLFYRVILACIKAILLHIVHCPSHTAAVSRLTTASYFLPQTWMCYEIVKQKPSHVQSLGLSVCTVAEAVKPASRCCGGAYGCSSVFFIGYSLLFTSVSVNSLLWLPSLFKFKLAHTMLKRKSAIFRSYNRYLYLCL